MMMMVCTRLKQISKSDAMSLMLLVRSKRIGLASQRPAAPGAFRVAGTAQIKEATAVNHNHSGKFCFENRTCASLL